MPEITITPDYPKKVIDRACQAVGSMFDTVGLAYGPNAAMDVACNALCGLAAYLGLDKQSLLDGVAVAMDEFIKIRDANEERTS